MREIWEEVSTYFFLDRESFMKIIYRRDKWSEFIISTIPYRSVSFTIYDILYGRSDRPDRTKYRSYPEKISEQYENHPDNIHEQYPPENIRHKTSFDTIFSESIEIKCWKKIFLTRRYR